MRRTDEDQEIVDRGKLWIEFRNTEWAKDLSRFLNTQIKTLTDSVVTLTLAQDFESAKVDAMKLAGFDAVREFIENDAVERMNNLIENEQAQKAYDKEIPSHV